MSYHPFFLHPLDPPPFSLFFFFNDTATTEIYTLSLHDALPIYVAGRSALEGWQLGDGLDLVGREQGPHPRQRIARHADPLAGRGALLGQNVLAAHHGRRVRSEEGVAPEVLGVRRAVQEQEERQVREAPAGRQRVGERGQLLD